MPNGPHIWDSRSDGILALRHDNYQENYDLQYRASVLCVEIKDRLLPPKYPREAGQWLLHSEPKVGDLNNATFWQKNTRQISGWSFAWPSITVKGASGTTGGSTGGGAGTTVATRDSHPSEQNNTLGIIRTPPTRPQSGNTVALPPTGQNTNTQTQAMPESKPTSVLPLNGMKADNRFSSKTPQSLRDINKKLWPLFPVGFVGITIADVYESQQQDVFHPTDPRLVVAQGCDPDMGSIVLGIKSSTGEIDENYAAKLQSAFRVVKRPDGGKLPYGKYPFVALNIGQSATLDSIGGAIIAGKSAGFLSSAYGGPLHPGSAADQHKIDSADGVDISSAHLSLNALFLSDTDQSKDGPLEFETDPFPPDVGTGNKKMKVHLQWDENTPHNHFTGQKVGKWRWWAESSFQDSPEQPCRPPPSSGLGGRCDGGAESDNAQMGGPTQGAGGQRVNVNQPGGWATPPPSGGMQTPPELAGGGYDLGGYSSIEEWRIAMGAGTQLPPAGSAYGGEMGTPFTEEFPPPYPSTDYGGSGSPNISDQPWLVPNPMGTGGYLPAGSEDLSTAQMIAGETGGYQVPTEMGGAGRPSTSTTNEIQSPSTSTVGAPIVPGASTTQGTSTDTRPPVVGRDTGYTAQTPGGTTTSSAGTSSPPGTGIQYTHPPCSGIEYPGTASGGTVSMPGDVVIYDLTGSVISTNAEVPTFTTGILCSVVYKVAAPGVNWACGIPDLSTGGVSSGYSWRVKNGGLSFHYHDASANKAEAVKFTPTSQIAFKSGTSFWGTLQHANLSDKVYTFPNLTGYVALNSWTNGLITANYIPYGSGGALTQSVSFQYDGAGLVTIGQSSTSTAQLKMYNAGSPNYLILQTGATAANITYTLPAAAPAVNGYALTSTTAGVMSWASVAGGVTSAQGTANQVLVNGGSGAPVTGAITLTTPQDIGTASQVQFGRVGIGVAPSYLMHIDSDTGSQAHLMIEEHDSGYDSLWVVLRKSRGTHASQSAVINGDKPANIFCELRDSGGGWRKTGSLGWVVDGTVTSTSIPTSFYISTSDAGDTNPWTNETYRFVVTSAGKVGIGPTNSAPTALLDVNSDIFRLRTAKTPATAGAAGNPGDICWDSGFVYVCVGASSWKKAAIAAW